MRVDGTIGEYTQASSTAALRRAMQILGYGG